MNGGFSRNDAVERKTEAYNDVRRNLLGIDVDAEEAERRRMLRKFIGSIPIVKPPRDFGEVLDQARAGRSA